MPSKSLGPVYIYPKSIQYIANIGLNIPTWIFTVPAKDIIEKSIGLVPNLHASFWWCLSHNLALVHGTCPLVQKLSGRGFHSLEIESPTGTDPVFAQKLGEKKRCGIDVLELFMWSLTRMRTSVGSRYSEQHWNQRDNENIVSRSQETESGPTSASFNAIV